MFVNDDVQLERTSICNECSSNVLKICTECGCIIPAKVTLAFAKCPLDKWQPIIK